LDGYLTVSRPMLTFYWSSKFIWKMLSYVAIRDYNANRRYSTFIPIPLPFPRNGRGTVQCTFAKTVNCFCSVFLPKPRIAFEGNLCQNNKISLTDFTDFTDLCCCRRAKSVTFGRLSHSLLTDVDFLLDFQIHLEDVKLCCNQRLQRQ